MPEKPTGSESRRSTAPSKVLAANANGADSAYGAWRATRRHHTGKRCEVRGTTQAHARLVGPANAARTAGSVRHLGKRPAHAASVVFGLLDPAAGRERR